MDAALAAMGAWTGSPLQVPSSQGVPVLFAGVLRLIRYEGNVIMNLSKSIDFLLENAGPVIQYRLRREILRNITAAEEEKFLGQIYETPHFRLVQGYAKPGGYIGSGMHSWDNWRGVKLHKTPLQDGEAAARLLSYYAVPKDHPLVKNFVAAMRDEDTLREAFSYIPPEVHRFETRFVGLNSGFCLMTLLYAMQAMLGYGDDVHFKWLA